MHWEIMTSYQIIKEFILLYRSLDKRWWPVDIFELVPKIYQKCFKISVTFFDRLQSILHSLLSCYIPLNLFWITYLYFPLAYFMNLPSLFPVCSAVCCIRPLFHHVFVEINTSISCSFSLNVTPTFPVYFLIYNVSTSPLSYWM